MIRGRFGQSGEDNYNSLSGLLYKYSFYFLNPQLLNLARVPPDVQIIIFNLYWLKSTKQPSRCQCFIMLLFKLIQFGRKLEYSFLQHSYLVIVVLHG